VGLCSGTVHCRTEGPELCALDMLAFLRGNYPRAKQHRIDRYQPSLLETLAESEYDVRVLDLNPPISPAALRVMVRTERWPKRRLSIPTRT
jgi:hypothetical protein